MFGYKGSGGGRAQREGGGGREKEREEGVKGLGCMLGLSPVVGKDRHPTASFRARFSFKLVAADGSIRGGK